jgi:trehalose-6-phosphate synthase
MKLSLRLIAYLVISISLVTFVVARSQVRAEKQGLRDDLSRRAKVLTESLQETIESISPKDTRTQYPRIVERFGNRERLAGIAIYGRGGELLLSTAGLEQTLKDPPDAFVECKANDSEAGGFTKLGETSMYVYAVPVDRDNGFSGAVVTFHDASYIDAQSVNIWRAAIWHGVAQVLLIVLITFLVIRWTILGPIIRVSKWMQDLRHGKVGTAPRPSPAGFLKKLTSEAESMAHSLTQARMAAKEEAQLREAADSQWTAERLRVGVRKRLKGNALYVVSNREPYLHVRRGKTIEVQVPASGLVTALEPILCACEGTWIAHGSADADREMVDAHDRLRVPPDQPQYTLRRVWLTKEQEDGYYFGFANEGIWPLCHIAHTRPTFRAADWERYREVNEKFAQALAEEIENAEQPFILIQDYHFALLPRLIKKLRPDARVAIFWHIPWPNPEAFGICPWQAELLDGLLGADLVSFHIQAHCNNFLETVDHAIECRIEWDRFVVNRNNHFTSVRAHPISVAMPEWKEDRDYAIRHPDFRTKILESLGPDTLFLGVGVDRVDYTKGLVERFRGIERLFEKHPQYYGRFTFVQFGAPSRTTIKRYKDHFDEVGREAERINQRFQLNQWKPIVFRNRHHSHEEIEPYYKAADVCMVTSLHDGMNLVAKEFVAVRDDEDGVLVLSQFTGASRELHDALLVNPYDTEQLADALRRALEMPLEERQARMQRMRRTVKDHNVYRWAADLIAELAEIRLDASEAQSRSAHVASL